MIKTAQYQQLQPEDRMTLAARQQPVEDGVGDRGVADPGMPVLDGQPAGHDGGARAGPVIDDFQQA